MSINSYRKYIKSLLTNCDNYDFTDKETAIAQHVDYMLNRTQSMFEWRGLPDSIPQRILELYLQVNGNCCFYRHNGELYIFVGGMGGEPDVYYRPTIYMVANPALKLSKQLKINEECAVVANDSLWVGLLPLMRKYATALVETELSMDIATVNSRLISLISSNDDRTRMSAEKYLADLRDGEQGVVADKSFLDDGIKVQPYASQHSNVLTNIIELLQYQKASFYNDIGLNANYNMKRESLNSVESQLNNDALIPLVNDMLRMRRKGIENVNKMFGTEIEVDFASPWNAKKENVDNSQENDEQAIDDRGDIDVENRMVENTQDVE